MRTLLFQKLMERTTTLSWLYRFYNCSSVLYLQYNSSPCLYIQSHSQGYPLEPASKPSHWFQVLYHQRTSQQILFLKSLYEMLEVSSARVLLEGGLIGISRPRFSAGSI